MPKVSVIIPNYNHEKFLKQRFESVLNQSFQDFEIIYLDDASTDDSNNICAHYASDPRLTTIFYNENSGSPFVQWNRGVAKARGEYIWIAESDDSADREFLAHLVSVLDSNQKLGLVYSQSSSISESGEIIKENTRWWTDDIDAFRWQNSYQNSGIDEVAHFLIRKNIIPNASAVLFRKEAYVDAGLADESFKYCGDWLMWVKILRNCDIAYEPRSLNLFREQHSKSVRSITFRKPDAVCETLRVMTFIKQYFPVSEPSLSDAMETRFRLWKEVSSRHFGFDATNREILRLFGKLSKITQLKALVQVPLFWSLSSVRALRHSMRNSEHAR
ncbi:glycosyltransferase family 2 protein [Pseudomonadota bacterium]